MAIAKDDILEAVSSMSVLELNELVKAFEDYQAGRLGTIPAVRQPLPAENHPGHDVL